MTNNATMIDLLRTLRQLAPALSVRIDAALAESEAELAELREERSGLLANYRRCIDERDQLRARLAEYVEAPTVVWMDIVQGEPFPFTMFNREVVEKLGVGAKLELIARLVEDTNGH